MKRLRSRGGVRESVRARRARVDRRRCCFCSHHYLCRDIFLLVRATILDKNYCTRVVHKVAKLQVVLDTATS
jgi:hypothetical protein